MNTFIFIFIVFFHWVFDFIFQDEDWAVNKSKCLKALLKHTSVYSVLWLIPVYMVTGEFSNSLFFVLITFFSHTLTDFLTSKVVSDKFSKGEYGSSIPNLGGFSVIGFDQFLHYVQLILTWGYLFT